MENTVQFVNDSWRFVKRTVNLNNLGLGYSDIDFPSNTIYIDRQFGRKSFSIDFHTLTCMCRLSPIY